MNENNIIILFRYDTARNEIYKLCKAALAKPLGLHYFFTSILKIFFYVFLIVCYVNIMKKIRCNA